MFDLRSKSSRFAALALTAVTTLSALTFMPSAPSYAAAGTVTDGLCSAVVSETAGVTVDSLDGYCYVAFKSTGINYSWTAPAGISKVDLLVVGGGGGGGSRHAGGGGAGGLLNSVDLPITSGSVAITVGAGGTGGGTSVGTNGNPGSNTTVSGAGISKTAFGGGYGAAGQTGGSLNASGTAAGSGGGGGNNSGSGSGTSTRSTGTAGQGNRGGWGYYETPWVGGGGGGAGAVGGDATSLVTGAGGNGLPVSWISTAASTSLAVGQISSSSVYFAGGGAGGGTYIGYNSMTVGAAGLGGGGFGQYNTASDGGSGTPNTGGGGGGSGQNGGWGNGGSGGSGVVVVRYPAPKQVLSYNFSDINSYDSSAGTAVNDLSSGGTYDATLTAGTNSNTASFSTSNGSLSFAGGASNSGPYVALPSISTTGFSTLGMTFDFEADFGAVQDAWESVVSLSASGGTGDLVYIGRYSNDTKIIMELYQAGSSTGFCYADGIPASGHTMNRWTFAIDGSSCKIYKNGVAVTTTMSAGYTIGKPRSGVTWASGFLAKANTNVDSFEGVVRSMRIYQGALTADQVGAPSYKTVTYDSNGSGASATTAYTSGAVKLPAGPSRTGYTFTNWYSDAGATNLVGAAGATYTPTANTTLYAGWASTSNIVNYNYNGATAGATPTSTTVNVSASTTLPSPTKTGYYFGGWYSDSSFTTKVGDAGATYTPSGTGQTIGLWARWSTMRPSNLVVNLDATSTSSYPSAGTSLTSIWPGSSSISSFSVNNITRDTTAGQPTSMNFATSNTAKYVDMGSSNDAAIDGDMTLETWINCSALRNPYGIDFTNIATRWFHASNSDVSDFHFAIRYGKLNLFTTNNSNLQGTTDLTSSCNGTKWILVGFSITQADGSNTLKFYVNGKVDATITGVTHGYKPNAALYLGDHRVDMPFQGKMARFRLYNAAVPEADMLSNYLNESPTFNYVNRTVTFDANDGSGSPATATQTYNQTTNLDANAFTRSGYAFAGWATSANGSVVYANSASYSFGSDTTLYAKWTANNATVTFDANGGSGSMSNQVTNVATNLTANTFTRTGYSFAGWATTANGTVAYADGASYAFTANATLYAKWTAIPNKTVTFDANNGSGTMTAQATNVATNLTTNTFTRSGYTFAGWATTANGTVAYADAASYAFTADTTLYAQWTALPNKTVGFNSNGGSGSMSNQVTNVATNLTANTFTRNGFSFSSWNTAANGTGTTYADGASYAFTADITLWAQWTALPNKTVTFDANNGTGTISAQATNVATNLTANAFNRDGYTFAGWNTAANGSGTPYANNASYAFTANITLYAQWTAVNYTITYNSPGSTSGSVPTDSANYNIGRSVAMLGNSGSLVRTGYTFAGWTVAADGSGTVLVSGSTLTFSSANINVYAKWTANTYTISYNVNGATGAQANTSDTYTTAGTAVTLSAVGTMAKAGHTFNGWATTASGTPIAGTYTTTANVTLYAQWTINTITVTYDKGSAGGTSLSSHGFTNFPTSAGSGNYGTRLNLSNSIDGTITVGSDVYTFVGWNDGTSIYATGTSFLLQSDVTMTAVWALTHAVRYTFNGGTAANGTSSVDTECGLANSRCTDQQGITLNVAPTRDGYTFAGWRDQSGADFAAGSNVTVTSTSYLFYAQWTAIPYTVTYLPNGGASTPTEASKNIGDRFTVANAVNRTGYTFGGWFDGAVTYGPGATYVVGTANVSFTAQWIANIYTINYDWNGGSGSALADGSYTVGTTGITLPGVTDQVKDGYTFGGWATSIGGVAVSSPFVPTADATLYAIWGSGSYNITYAPELGTVATTTVTVANGNSINLETPTRQGFVFDGWFTAQTGGTRVGGGNSSFTPAASRTLHARWTQASIYGIPVGNLSRLGSLNASGSANSTYSGSNANSSVSVNVPSGALPTGTQVNIDMISDNTHASGLINGNKSFILSVAVSWLAGDGTVPDTASGKAISVTLNNSGIKAGALIYSIQGTSVVLLGTATQDGTVTFELTQDPGIYVVATSPTAPQNASSTTTSNSATISWQAPSSDGGDAITGYTVTLNSGATCTTTGALSCTISGLNAGTTYTYTVTATNSVGTSPTTSGSFSITANQTVVFDANGGTGSMSSQASNTSGSLTVNTFTRSGYAFTGWNTAANGSGTPYADGATYAFTAGTTLYAQWSASTYTVTYNYNSATNQNGPSSAGFTSGGSAVTLPSPTKIGYSFDGWFTDAGLSTLLGAGGFSYSPSASITLYAKFTALPNQTVIFDANGGTGTMSNQVTNVATSLTSNAFTKSGYTFAGWNTAANGSGTSYADGASFAFTAGATLYAQWALIPVVPPVVTPPTPQYERPDAPTNVTAAVVAGGDSITVSWSAPTFTGGTAIVNYRVTSSSGMACITTDTSCTFNGVNKDVSYSFTVTSNNGYRDSLPSSASNAVLIPSQLKNQAPISAAGSQTARGAAVKVVVAGGSTNGPIIYDVANGTATGCSIDGEGWLTATTSGTCLVTVTMLGDFTYKPVTASTSVTFLCKLVAQAPLAITSTGSTSVTLGTTGGSGFGSVSYSVTDGTTDCVLTGNILTAAKTGTCVVAATKAADDVYEAATASATITVTAAKPIIVTPPPIVKVDPVKHVVAVAPTGKPVLVGTPISKPIIFGADSAKLDGGDIKQLKSVAAYVKAKKLSVLVTGFAKAAGKSSFIEKLLATSRAKAVATYLRKLGVNVDISFAGYGAYNKAKPSINDRRVEIRWIAKD